MIFNSYRFFIFFVIVMIIYGVIPKKIRYVWLLIASYFYYMSWSLWYGLLIGFITLVSYATGLLLGHVDAVKCNRFKLTKLILACGVILDISALIFLKYAGFVVTNINFVLNRAGLSQISIASIALPVGISFYTFQSLGYIIDVYYKRTKIERNIFRYALFVSFFPQLLSGPIERADRMLQQIDTISYIKVWELERISRGLILVLWGFFQKLVIADRISIFVDNVYSKYWMYGTVELVIATVFFAIQIYCDFGSYSLIAIGIAKILGIDLSENFNTPYLSLSIKDFWRRWHISLSSWFRDYIYIPLGGSRCSKWKKYRNILITFAVSGLWHGASWSFIIWGALHGGFQILEDMLDPIEKRIISKCKVKTQCMSFYLGKMCLSFVLVSFAWIFFKMNSVSNSINFIQRIFTRLNLWVLHNGSLYNLGLDRTEMNILFGAILVMVFVDLVRYFKGVGIDTYLKNQNIWFRWGVCFGLFFAIITYGIYGPSYDPTSFIYFQF